MRIRNMILADYGNVYALWSSCTGMGLNSIDDSQRGIALFLKRNPDTCFVAEDNATIAGVILAGNDGRRGFIYHTAVDPLHRGKGIGKKLVDAALASLKSLGISKVALVVFERNEKGNIFWEQQGFTERNDLIYRNKAITEMTRIDT